jgi:hypothetical protein
MIQPSISNRFALGCSIGSQWCRASSAFLSNYPWDDTILLNSNRFFVQLQDTFPLEEPAVPSSQEVLGAREWQFEPERETNRTDQITHYLAVRTLPFDALPFFIDIPLTEATHPCISRFRECRRPLAVRSSSWRDHSKLYLESRSRRSGYEHHGSYIGRYALVFRWYCAQCRQDDLPLSLHGDDEGY